MVGREWSPGAGRQAVCTQKCVEFVTSILLTIKKQQQHNKNLL
jgi:hypothetical protein